MTLAGDGDGEGDRRGLTRRDLISGAAVLGVNAAAAGPLLGARAPLAHGARRSPRARRAPAAEPQTVVPFYGPHQAGIVTPAQEYLNMAAFDLNDDSREQLRSLLERWTTAAAALTAGDPYEPEPQSPDRAPQDTGEAIGLGPAGLTLTFGFGPGLFAAKRSRRLGIDGRRPAELRVLPPFAGERLDPASSGGDLCVQACADDPQVAFHAVHVLTRLAGASARLRWSQLGFGRTSSTSRAQSTPRNLMGFKDGTHNLRAEETAAVERFVWVAPGEGPRWMAGGSFMIARRIRILFGAWDATALEGQERTIGRKKLSGAPLGGEHEYDAVDLQARDSAGAPVIPANAHIRLAGPQDNGGERILRRGYSYSAGAQPGDGELDAGLFFIAFQRSPQRQFIPLQRRLAGSDALDRFTVHTSSAIFACPPGVLPGGFLGELLLG